MALSKGPGCAVVAIGVESATARAVAGCQGDREPKAAEEQDSEEVGRVCGVCVVWDGGEWPACVWATLGCQERLARGIQTG